MEAWSARLVLVVVGVDNTSSSLSLRRSWKSLVDVVDTSWTSSRTSWKSLVDVVGSPSTSNSSLS